MIRKLFVLVSLLLMVSFSLLSGCASLPSRAVMESEVSDFKLPKTADKDNALIYVVRPSSAGKLIRFNVFVDDKEDSSEMGYTRGSQFIYFFVKPGNHTILSKAENWSELFIDAKAGEIYFFRQDASMGFVMARNELLRIPDYEGKYQVKNTDLGTIIKERK